MCWPVVSAVLAWQVIVKLEASMNFVPMRLNLWCALVMWHIEFGDMHSFTHALKYFVVLT